jgi:hypothetical protein
MLPAWRKFSVMVDLTEMLLTWYSKEAGNND